MAQAIRGRFFSGGRFARERWRVRRDVVVDARAQDSRRLGTVALDAAHEGAVRLARQHDVEQGLLLFLAVSSHECLPMNECLGSYRYRTGRRSQ